jgi:hypothetical protein
VVQLFFNQDHISALAGLRRTGLRLHDSAVSGERAMQLLDVPERHTLVDDCPGTCAELHRVASQAPAHPATVSCHRCLENSGATDLVSRL